MTMKDKICIFAGTTEGRKLAALLCDAVELKADTVVEKIQGLSNHGID